MGVHNFRRGYRDGNLESSGKGEYVAGVGHMRGWGAGVPTDGTSGTLLAPGALYTDTTNGNMYKNDGTLASPAYDLVGTQGESPTFTTVTATTFVGNLTGGVTGVLNGGTVAANVSDVSSTDSGSGGDDATHVAAINAILTALIDWGIMETPA